MSSDLSLLITSRVWPSESNLGKLSYPCLYCHMYLIIANNGLHISVIKNEGNYV